MLAAALTPDDAGILKDKDLKSTCTARACVGARAKRKKEFFVLPVSLWFKSQVVNFNGCHTRLKND